MRFNQAALPSLQIRAHHRSPDPSSRRFSGRGLFQAIAKVRPVSVHSVTRCHIACLCFSSSSLVHRSKCSTLPPFQWFRSILHQSQTTEPIPTIFCFSLFGTYGAGSFQKISNHLVVECGIHSHLEYQSRKVVHCRCSTESRDWLRSNICANFRGEDVLDTEVSVLYSFLYLKTIVYQCVSFGCPAPNRSAKAFAVELSLWISPCIGNPRSM